MEEAQLGKRQTVAVILTFPLQGDSHHAPRIQSSVREALSNVQYEYHNQKAVLFLETQKTRERSFWCYHYIVDAMRKKDNARSKHVPCSRI